MVGAMGALTAAGAKATVQGMWDALYPDMALEGLEVCQWMENGVKASIGIYG